MIIKCLSNFYFYLKALMRTVLCEWEHSASTWYYVKETDVHQIYSLHFLADLKKYEL